MLDVTEGLRNGIIAETDSRRTFNCFLNIKNLGNSKFDGILWLSFLLYFKYNFEYFATLGINGKRVIRLDIDVISDNP